MGNIFRRIPGRFAFASVMLLLPLLARSQPVIVVSAPTNAVIAGTSAGVWVNALNVSTQQVSWLFPVSFPCKLASGEKSIEAWAQLRDRQDGGAADIGTNSFARREYLLPIPAGWSGEITILPREISAARLVMNVEPRPSETETNGETANAPAPTGVVMGILSGEWRQNPDGSYDPESFFKEHIFGYEPFYFIAGTKSPNAKFQISFKYRILNEHGWLAEKQPWLAGLHIAYSQQSLWDWNAPSAPFYDSTYMPEVLYSWNNVFRSSATNWFRLDLQGGLQHQSNGKSGGDSRSLNIAYLRPTLVFGRDDAFQLKIIPRFWTYLGDLGDNPDIADYRGYGDLRATIGWPRGLQLSALGRAGKDFDHGSVELDLTYPLMHPPRGALSLYLMVQYFNGYGESLLDYNQKSEALRVGVSLYR